MLLNLKGKKGSRAPIWTRFWPCCAPRKSAADAADAAAACCHFAALISGPVTIGCIAGCAGATADLETTRLRSICALAALDGRLDLLPTGPGLLSARVVTLNRQAALEAIQGLDDDQPTGLTKVRVEGPRPLLAVVLQLEDAAGAVFLRHPITLAIARERWDQERREKLEAWVFDQGGSVIHMDAPPAEELMGTTSALPAVSSHFFGQIQIISYLEVLQILSIPQ